MSDAGDASPNRSARHREVLGFRPLGSSEVLDATRVGTPFRQDPGGPDRGAPTPPEPLQAAEWAHDLNNVLGVILVCAAELERGGGDESTVRERAAEIRRAAEQGSRLSRALTLRARPGSPDPPEPIDVARAATELEPLLRHTLGPGVAVERSIDPDTPLALIDGGSLDRILLNLAGNAAAAMGGHGLLGIEIARETVGAGDRRLGPGWYVRIRVSDDGVGMSAEVLSRALDPFFTTSDATGTGLGLATVARACGVAGGDVRIRSLLGVGTTVTVLLPAAGSDGTALALRRRQPALA